MNSAWQDFSHHRWVLRERMLHPSDFEKAVYYFLEEFAGDKKFIQSSDRAQMPHLVAVLKKLVSNAVGREVTVEGALVSYLREHRFVHGNARADGRIVLFFYSEEGDTGMVILIPQKRRYHPEVHRRHANFLRNIESVEKPWSRANPGASRGCQAAHAPHQIFPRGEMLGWCIAD